MNEALFVLSTGRCGTQWLADALARRAGGRAEVTHEPLHDAYMPRLMLAAGDPRRLPDDAGEPILEHVEAIDATLQTKQYIECGYPAWSTIPYLLKRFAGRVRVVHLVRHPVPTALSWLTQTAYTPPAAPHLPERTLLSPFDAGVSFPSYRERWGEATPYEKALYYWLEVNAFALRLQKQSSVPWLTVRFEELIREEGAEAVSRFAGLGERAAGLETHLDEHRFVTPFWSDPHRIAQHPEVMELARELGYEPQQFDAQALQRRYDGRR